MQEMVRKNILKAFHDGRLEEVAFILQDILAKDPDHAEAIQFLGAKYLLSHQAPYAIALIGNFLERKKKENLTLLRNNEARLYQTLGRALLAENHFEAALVAFKNAVRLLPEEAAHHASLGELLLSLSHYDEAIAPLETALKLAPHHADIMLFLVQAYFALGNSLKAAFYCRLFLELRPNAPVMRANLGAILLGLDELEEACSTLERALKEGCDTPETRMNLALAALRLGDVKRACHLFKVALAESKDSSSFSEVYYRILLNYGTALYEAGRYEEAEKLFCEIEKADYEALILEKSQASFNRAAIFLGRGEWREGWEAFEKRLLFSPLSLPKEIEALPLWDGTEKGGLLVVYVEQGLGDMVQFLRYLPKILETHSLYLAFSQEQKDFIENFLVIPPSLKGKILNNLQRDAKIDGRVSLLSLPYYLKEEGFSLRPYVKNIIPQKEEGSFTIGLSWQGNKNYAFDRRRSVSFSLIEEFLKEFPQKYPVKFIALEQNSSEKASWLEYPQNNSLEDLATIICQCDLIIAIDSLAAHIAGAMGKKLWLLNRFGGDWRWKHQDLYQDVRIFQAKEIARPEEEWRENLKMLAEDLKEWCAY